jgi:hypothetical protein
MCKNFLFEAKLRCRTENFYLFFAKSEKSLIDKLLDKGADKLLKQIKLKFERLTLCGICRWDFVNYA